MQVYTHERHSAKDTKGARTPHTTPHRTPPLSYMRFGFFVAVRELLMRALGEGMGGRREPLAVTERDEAGDRDDVGVAVAEREGDGGGGKVRVGERDRDTLLEREGVWEGECVGDDVELGVCVSLDVELGVCVAVDVELGVCVGDDVGRGDRVDAGVAAPRYTIRMHKLPVSTSSRFPCASGLTHQELWIFASLAGPPSPP